MIITAITAQQKNQDRVNIFVDNAYSFSLSLDELLSEHLKKGDELDEKRLDALKKLSADGKLYARTLEWTMIRPHSQKEVRDYLRRKKADDELQKTIIGRLVKSRAIDDEQFADWFWQQRSRKNRSERAIVQELRQKGVDSEIIGLIGARYRDDAVAIRELITKVKNKPRYADPKKLMSYLSGKGFSYDLIKEVLSEQESDSSR